MKSLLDSLTEEFRMTCIGTNYQTLRRPNFVTLILVLDSIFDSLSVKVEIKTDSETPESVPIEIESETNVIKKSRDQD